MKSLMWRFPRCVSYYINYGVIIILSFFNTKKNTNLKSIMLSQANSFKWDILARILRLV